MTFKRISADVFDAETLDLFKAASASGRDWDSKTHVKAKDSLKKILIDAQKGRCAYCRRPIRNEIGHLEIDHILPKAPSGTKDRYQSNDRNFRRSTAGYSSFTFLPTNLCLVCKRCNQRKGSFDHRRYRNLAADAEYVLKEDYYDWVHPHIHDYSEHIEMLQGFIFHARDGSSNGECVISVCDLDSVAAVERAASDLRIKNADDYVEAILAMLTQIKEYGWDYIIEAVQQTFPNIPPEEIADSAANIEKEMARGRASRSR